MMKRYIKKGLLILLLFFISTPTVVAKEFNTLGEYEDHLNDLIYKRNQNDKKQQQTEAQIKEKENAIKNAEMEMSKAENEIHVAEEKIEESNKKIEELKKETENLLQFLQQMKSQNAYIEYVTGASNMTELIMRIAAIEQITDYNQETLDNLDNVVKENKRLKEDLKKKQEDLKIKITNYQKTIENLTGDLEGYDKFERDLNGQVKDAQESYNLYKKICSNNPITAPQGRKAKIVDCLNSVSNSSWLKPLNQGVITSTIGTRWGSYHNALDIGGNPEGTPVYAAAAGTVANIIWRYYCGGNMVYINTVVNGKNYTTYYYHLLTVNVSVGQTVTQNTIIGTVGGGRQTSASFGGYDTCTTGAHLHYGVATGFYPGTIYRANVITPPGFPNYKGYRFYSRTDFYS